VLGIADERADMAISTRMARTGHSANEPRTGTLDPKGKTISHRSGAILRRPGSMTKLLTLLRVDRAVAHSRRRTLDLVTMPFVSTCGRCV
jgi:hypothetical protein